MTTTSRIRRQSLKAQGRFRRTNGISSAAPAIRMRSSIFITADHRSSHPDGRCYAFRVSEIAIGILVIGVLFIADADRLQAAIDRLRELAAWLAE